MSASFVMMVNSNRYLVKILKLEIVRRLSEKNIKKKKGLYLEFIVSLFLFTTLLAKKKRECFQTVTQGIAVDPVRLMKFHLKCPSNCPKIYNTESAYAVSLMKYRLIS